MSAPRSWGRTLGDAKPDSGEARSGATLRASPPAATGLAVDRVALALSEPETYRNRSDPLRDLLFAFARQRPEREDWEKLLEGPRPDVSQAHFADGSAITASMLSRWTVLWGMTLAGDGIVPLEWLNEAWTTPANPAEKYYATAPAAIWTAGEIGQDDTATLDALVARLDREDDPLWLTGDVVGALTALTGERFAYDRDAWRAWWQDARADWPR